MVHNEGMTSGEAHRQLDTLPIPVRLTSLRRNSIYIGVKSILGNVADPLAEANPVTPFVCDETCGPCRI